jgi:small-conductance mechanosensitive channel
VAGDFEGFIDGVSALAGAILRGVTHPASITQLAVAAALYFIALLLSRRVEPPLIERAKAIVAYPGLSRFVVAFLSRLEWAFFIVAMAVWLAIMRTYGWFESDQLTYVLLLLAAAWLVIFIASHMLTSPLAGRLVAVAGWAYVALAVLGVTDTATELLDAAAFSLGGVRISLLLMLKALVFFGGTLWVAVSLGNFLDQRVQRSRDLTPSVRVLIGKVLKITLITVATVVAVSGIGIDLTVFAVLSGAIGVGIGFGLQKVVSNFISGLIILLDRSIKPGDTISLGETFGWIRELRARFVSVVTREGREFLIPNEDFITREVINWSFSDEFVRLDVDFGVSYDSNPHQVSELAIAAAAGVERVVGTPAPVCWLTGFGDSSLDFVLRFWIRDPQKGLTNVRGQVLLALWDAFKANGVAIPYPHREVIMKQVGPPPARLPGDV